MMPDEWKRSWSEANSRLVHNARRVSGEELRHYWDRRSAYYGELTRGDEALREAVISYLVRENVLMPGDSVLDIGCGTGQFTLPMAQTAGTVTGLDISRGMLGRMMGEAAGKEISNVRSICSTWEKYEKEKKYDLVFSAFCPGVNDPEALFKMESFSARSCCFVTGGGIGQPAFISELLEIFTGEVYPVIDTDDFFSFNVLHEAGRKPSVRSFSHDVLVKTDPGHMLKNAILYFDMLLGLDKEREEIIIDYFKENSISANEDKAVEERSLYVISWDSDT